MKLYDILGTKDKKLQEKRAAQLLTMAQQPVVDIIIRSDRRLPDPVDLRVFGVDQIPYQEIYDILDQAKKLVMQMELQASAASQTPPVPAEGAQNEEQTKILDRPGDGNIPV